MNGKKPHEFPDLPDKDALERARKERGRNTEAEEADRVAAEKKDEDERKEREDDGA